MLVQHMLIQLFDKYGRCSPLLALLLVACSANDIKHEKYEMYDENSPYFAVPAGSVLTLNQQLTITGDQVAVYVQDGALSLERNINKYHPNCKFEIYTMSEQSRLVQVDKFNIIKVVDELESSSIQNSVQLASLNAALNTVLGMGMLDRSSVFNYATMMYLSSEHQKDVYRMTCQHWGDIVDDKHLSVEEMRAAMGKIFSLELKEH